MKYLVLTIALAVALLLAAPETNIHFTDVTTAAGIKFHHNAGKTGKKYLPETMGSGVAFFDADGDGKLNREELMQFAQDCARHAPPRDDDGPGRPDRPE